jgi:hypothetical protein
MSSLGLAKGYSPAFNRVKKQDWEKPLMSIENQCWIGLSFQENLV